MIYSVKGRYRRWYLRWLLTQTLLDPGCISHISKMKPDLRVGIVCLAEIWEDLPADIIVSSWTRAGIMPVHLPGGDDPITALDTQRHQDSAEIADLIAALPNGNTDLYPQWFIMEDAIEPGIGASAVDFLVTQDPDMVDEDGPDSDTSTNSTNSTTPSDASDSRVDGEASEAGSEELNMGVPVSMLLGSLRLAKKFFEEHDRLYDIRFIYQLNRMINAVEAVQAGVAVRAARRQADIRSLFNGVTQL